MEQGGSDDEAPSSLGEFPSGQIGHAVFTEPPSQESTRKPQRLPRPPRPSAAGITAFATLISALVMAGQCRVMSKQVTLIESQKGISEKQAEIAGHQVEIAERQTTILDQQRDIMAGEHRPWMFPTTVQRASGHKAVADDAPFTIAVKNVGAAPALDISISLWVRAKEEDLPTEKAPDCAKECLECPTQSGNGSLPPQGTLAGPAHADEKISPADLARIDALTLMPYVFGNIRYRDHLGKAHATLFCRQIQAIDGYWRMSGCPQRECAN
jgi:hypothetical protein